MSRENRNTQKGRNVYMNVKYGRIFVGKHNLRMVREIDAHECNHTLTLVGKYRHI